MRRSALLVTTLVALVAASATLCAQGGRKPGRRPNAKPPSAKPVNRARLLIPGVGGSTPRKPGPPKPSAPEVLLGLPGPLPALPGPAQMPRPGAGADLGGLELRAAGPALYGLSVAWGPDGGIAGWDRDGGKRARRLAQLLRSAGATGLRVPLSWAQVEPRRGQMDWRATDRFMRFARELGVPLTCTLAGTPSWATESPAAAAPLLRLKGLRTADRPPSPAYYDDLGRFARSAAGRYRGLVRSWEFWSEPDGRGMVTVVADAAGKPVDARPGVEPKVYAALLSVFARAVRASNPAAMVAVGGLSDQHTDFLQGLYAAGASSVFDAVALHPYRDRGLVALEWVDACRDVMLRSGDAAKPIWITAWGWPTSSSAPHGVLPLHQARLVRESLEAMRRRPFIGAAFYESLNDWRGSSALRTAGLCTDDLRAKAGFAAFREAVTGRLPGPVMAFRRVPLMAGGPTGDEPGMRCPPVAVTVDAAKPGGPVPRVWEGYAQGSEPGGASVAQGLAGRLRGLSARLVRFDPFPDPGAVRAAAGGVRLASTAGAAAFDPGRVDWAYADRMMEAVTQSGARPMLTFGTMPTALSSPHSDAWLPRQHEEYAAFVRSVVARFSGEQRRAVGYWELAAPRLEGHAALAAWLRLYETFAGAVLAVDPTAKVGGPAGAGPDSPAIPALLAYCEERRVPLHFVSWSSYRAQPAALGEDIAAVRRMVAAHPGLKGVEVVLGEWAASPRVTPANDGLEASSYVLASAEVLMQAQPDRALFFEAKDGVSFRDPTDRFWGRWGLVTSDGQPKPSYNAFLMLSRLEGVRLPVASEDTDVRAVASTGRDEVHVLVWYRPGSGGEHAPDGDTPVLVRVTGLPWSRPTVGRQWLLDGTHGNAMAGPGRGELPQVAAFQVGPGALEVPVVLSPNGATLVELRPGAPTRTELSLRTSQYVVRNGEPFTVTATVRNAGSRPERVTVVVGSADPALISPGSGRLGPVRLAPGATQTLRLRVKAPARDDGGAFLMAKAGDTVASAAIRYAPALVARLEPSRVDIARPGAAADSLEATARFRVVLENRSPEPVAASVVGGTIAHRVNLGPRASVTDALSLTAPTASPSNTEVPIRVTVGERVVATLRAVVGVPGLCRHVTRPVRVNGDLSEWTEAYPLALEPLAPGGQVTAGAGVQVMTMWDEQSLYLAASLADDTEYQPHAAADIVRGDSVLLGVDARRNAVPGRGFDSDDYVFAVAPGRLRAQVYRLRGGRGGAGPAPEIAAAVRRAGGRTVYEVAVPWSSLAPMRPRDGAIIGTAILTNDSDGRSRRSAVWGGGLTGAGDPTRFLGLRLAR
ncbi:MAG: hypothetical protein IT208_07070 [Chthonomonadales bacterium]|nr:hypothetical protein [Chthonomonadales bacterium]